MQKVIFNWLLVLRCDNGADAKTLLMTLDRRSRRCQKNNGAIERLREYVNSYDSAEGQLALQPQSLNRQQILIKYPVN